jgi:soluble lytic murein transglycosylase-like protein
LNFFRYKRLRPLAGRAFAIIKALNEHHMQALPGRRIPLKITPRSLLVLILLLCTWRTQSSDADYGLDWYALLSKPEPAELMRLAEQYERAQGVRRDYSRARQLYCAAARLDYMPAQIRLAWMYANGLGAPQDKELAGAWLQVAANKDNLQARKFLVLLGELAGNRQPRCTYESRYDEYAIATIPSQDGMPENVILPDQLATDPNRRQIEQWVRQLAPHYGLDANLVLAVIATESNFNPLARSVKNARGLMQLIPQTAARFGVKDVSNPVQNLHGGMAYLRWLLDRFDGDLRLALAGYNAGEGAVDEYMGIPPYPETRNYVRKVIGTYGRPTHPAVKKLVAPSATNPVGFEP